MMNNEIHGHESLMAYELCRFSWSAAAHEIPPLFFYIVMLFHEVNYGHNSKQFNGHYLTIMVK